MNYLKSITTTVLNSTGVAFPFSIGERIPGIDPANTIWDIREGVRRDDATPLTLFIFDSTLPPLQPGNKDRRTLMQLARNALKKLRTIRHPDVLKYVDSVETDTHVYIATERVRPLEAVFRDWETGGTLTSSSSSKGKAREDWIGWGVKSIATATAFLNSPPLSLHHSYLIPSSVFITPSMEWRLGGFDLLTTRDDPAGVLWGLGGVAPGGAGERCGPEVRKGGWGVLRDTDPAQADTYLLALLLFSLYNPSSPLPSLTSQPSSSSSGALPKVLFPSWRRMLSPNPRTRLLTTSFVAEASLTGFWTNNPLASLVEGLDGFELLSEGDKLGLLRTIKDAVSSGTIPAPFLLYRVLPSLLHSLSLPAAPSGAMLPLVLDLGRLVPPADYGKLVLEPVVRLYASPDRGTRMALLDGLEQYADKLDAKTVQDKIWPHLITGFADTVPVIREATVKAIYPLASKLSDRMMNNDLLRLLARMQSDTEPSIRTNTCILLGRLAPNLGPNTKKKVLVPAFARSLKDPFVHARVAGLMALMATVELFDKDDLAGKVIPNMAFTLVDREKLVREQAFKAMNMFVKRLEGIVATMPDTVEERSPNLGPITTTSPSNSSTNQAGLVNSAAGAAGALAGWAIASLGKQLSSNEQHSSLSASSGATLAPPSSSVTPNGSSFSTPATSPRLSTDSGIFDRRSTTTKLPGVKVAPPVVRSNLGVGGSGLGMKLGGGKKMKDGGLEEVLADEWDDGDGSVENAWGDDLIDVNADADDWAAFESAPQTVEVPPPQSYYITPATPSKPTTTTTKPSLQTSPPKLPNPPSSVKVTTSIQSNLNPTSSQSKSINTSKTSTPIQSDAKTHSDSKMPSNTKTQLPIQMNQPQRDVKSPISTVNEDDSSHTNLATMSKEEKEKEMSRRREERKARIAAMKEGKKK
ncbi:SCY1 protein kinase [Tremella mesenterica]|uniref:SCY1 protein kinase n=1 Tax=Tremella mesenterica TaxID=5217 RepID=A0A4Q1BJF8_TREME|nr:SCY1 protein kinase [Tremella mesenterica]